METSKRYATITAVGGYVPDDVLTNDEIAQHLDTSDEWITTRVGIKERRLLNKEGAGSSYLGIKAVEDMMRRHGVKPEEIDLVLCSSNTPDYHFPTTASIIAAECGISGVPCFDFQGACPGFVYGLQIARGFVESYNLPLDEFMQVFDNAIQNGYGIAWGTDVSEVGFNRDGLGILIDADAAESTGSDQARWIGATPSEKRELINQLVRTPGAPEIKVTQEWRQKGFDEQTTTDDHGMVIYGIAKDQTGKKFYMVKNSWGDAGRYNGIWYASESFVAGKTINIVVHKDAIPKAIRTKLGI